MKLQLNKRKVKLAVVLVAVLGAVYLSRGLITNRAVQFKDCVAAKYDLRRETNFRWFTGACTAVGKDGGQVYVSQLRAFGTTNDNDGDHDHGY